MYVQVDLTPPFVGVISAISFPLRNYGDVEFNVGAYAGGDGRGDIERTPLREFLDQIADANSTKGAGRYLVEHEWSLPGQNRILEDYSVPMVLF